MLDPGGVLPQPACCRIGIAGCQALITIVGGRPNQSVGGASSYPPTSTTTTTMAQRLAQISGHLSNIHSRGLLVGEVAIITGEFQRVLVGDVWLILRRCPRCCPGSSVPLPSLSSAWIDASFSRRELEGVLLSSLPKRVQRSWSASTFAPFFGREVLLTCQSLQP